jgi:DNA polymerase-4
MALGCTSPRRAGNGGGIPGAAVSTVSRLHAGGVCSYCSEEQALSDCHRHPQHPMPRVIFHVDMDAFFASIEQRDHPEYKGKPVIVGSPPDRRGVVCAASYEARQFKVRSAMPSRTAGRLCPHGIFVRPRMDAYRAESQEIMKILRAVTPKVERVSVDEAYLEVAELPGDADTDSALEAALPVAREIKRRILEERNLTASVGIASNKFLAKLGSDFNKPNGLTLILEKDKVAFLRPLPVRSIHGVGPVTAQSLTDRGLHTIGDIQDTGMDLTPMVGSWAETLKLRALGIDDRPVDLSEDRKSISAENTFLNDTDDRPTLRAALKELATDVAQTLEKHALAALTVQVKVRYSDFSTLTRQVRLADPISNAADIYRLACYLLARHQLVTQPLRLIGIGVSTLVPPLREQLLLSI